MKRMVQGAALAGLALVAMGAERVAEGQTAAAPAVEQKLQAEFLPGDVTWRPNPIPGNQTARLYGAPDQPGLYTFRARLEKNALIPPHTHTDARMITVLEGELFAGLGPKFDENSGRLFPAGSFFVVPAGVAHFSWAKTGPVTYQEQGFGPSPTAFIKD